MPTIDLSQTNDYPTNALDAPSPKRVTYPSFSFSCDKVQDIPSGVFTATVKLDTKGMEWSKDEKGKKRCVYRFDVMELEPEENDDSSSVDEENDEPDAAAAIMDSMKKARSKKMTEGYDE